MRKHGSRKMVLAKETLRGLESTAIGRVAGGQTGPETCNQSCISDVSCATCHLICSNASYCC